MPIHVMCEKCGKVLSVPDDAAGRMIQCALCGLKMRVPEEAPLVVGEAEQPPVAKVVAPPPKVAPPAANAEPDKKDAFFAALAEEAAREQRQAEAARAAKAAADAELEPEIEKPPSTGAVGRAKPAIAVGGELQAKREVRIRKAADDAGYGVADEPLPPITMPTDEETPLQFRSRSHPMRKPVAIAGGVLLLVSIIVGLIVGLSGGHPQTPSTPVVIIPDHVTSVASRPVMPANAPPMPAALTEAAQALAANTPVEVEVVEVADAAAPMFVLTPAGDFMVDASNLKITDKNNAGGTFQQMRQAIRQAVYESVAGKLREKGLAPVLAGSAGARKPGEVFSRLKLFITATPVWAGFSFRAPPEGAPSGPGSSGPSGLHGTRSGGQYPRANYTPPGGRSGPSVVWTDYPPTPRPRPPYRPRPSPSAPPATAWNPPTNSVDFWVRLLSGARFVNARFNADAPDDGGQCWTAMPTEEMGANQLPCGLRISIVRVAWEVAGKTHELAGRPAAADAVFSANLADAAIVLPFRRPESLRALQISAHASKDRVCTLTGGCQYEDLDLRSGAAEAGKLVAALLPAPETDWSTLWTGTADRDSLAAACRNILRTGGGPAVAEAMAAKPDCLPKAAAEALAGVFQEEHSNPDWARPFLAVRGACGDAACTCLARQAILEKPQEFLPWMTAPADHSPESVEAACCALIDLGKPGPEVNALIDNDTVKAFTEVNAPHGALAFPAATAQKVLEWLIHKGTLGQRVEAMAAAIEGKFEELQVPVMACVGQPLGADPVTYCALCKGLEKVQSPPAFEVLSAVAKRRLMQEGVGSRFLPPEALSDPDLSPPQGRFSRTVAALVCADLARFDRAKAGPALVELLHSPDAVSRTCAIETLVRIDAVDVCLDVNTRFVELKNKDKARDACEAQEFELANAAQLRLCRYERAFISVANSINNRVAQAAIETCDKILDDKENPSPSVIARARTKKIEAEALQLKLFDKDKAWADDTRTDEVKEACNKIIQANLTPELVAQARKMLEAAKDPKPPDAEATAP